MWGLKETVKGKMVKVRRLSGRKRRIGSRMSGRNKMSGRRRKVGDDEEAMWRLPRAQEPD